ncbi:GTPase-associated system all-helical protein GASH [Pseudomonas coronafaciens]|uniref:GTPase-associated system all-helical protein GASH n=1 Tax=Pseudomonas coronafaciens TaxID=53409 RepID=UPI000F008BF5|nr:GTPase-associated system all-helical protein GASH [Pseudomonas coronafaciens]RMP27380.1 hypothetical protein ALQ25_00279 [Pseudomonas coronafaciens pv. atropurpurea]
MGAAEKPMNASFSGWYSTVSLGESSHRRQARWKGIVELVDNADEQILEALVRLAFQTRSQASQSSVLSIRQYFKDADDAFEMDGNDRELQILAASSLAVLMETPDAQESDRAALVVTTASVAGGRMADLPMDLAALGEHAICRLGESRRKRPSLIPSSDPPKFDFEKSVTKISEQPDWDGVAQAFTQAAESTRSALRMLAIRHAQSMTKAQNFIRIQDEELQMLWWLIGERSDHYNCAFDAIPSEAQPFVLASELADATAMLPGPRSIKSILSRAGLKERKKILVTAAVNGPDERCLRRLMNDVDPSPVTTPLHFAIMRQLETGAGDAWIPGWSAATEISAHHSLSKLIIGELFYRERLLLTQG